MLIAREWDNMVRKKSYRKAKDVVEGIGFETAESKDNEIQPRFR